ncbi:MAG: RHS repeat-associated core domain-containing protein [Bacteroidota bacterium]
MTRRGNSVSGLGMNSLSYVYNAAKSNRLLQVKNPAATTAATLAYGDEVVKNQAVNNYTHDLEGRLTGDVASGVYYTYYEASGLTKAVYSNAQKTILVEEYKYDEHGKRIEKLTYLNGAEKFRVRYLNDVNGNAVEVVEEAKTGSTWTLNATEKYLYGSSRIGMLRDNRYQYQLTDHTGNIRAMVSGTATAPTVMSFTDYYPHGSPLPGRNYTASPNRYSFQGQEKDATGKHAFELRMYDSKLGVWLTPDPMMQYASPYMSMGDNPVSFIDPTGGEDGSSYGDNDAYNRAQEAKAQRMWDQYNMRLNEGQEWKNGWGFGTDASGAKYLKYMDAYKEFFDKGFTFSKGWTTLPDGTKGRGNRDVKRAKQMANLDEQMESYNYSVDAQMAIVGDPKSSNDGGDPKTTKGPNYVERTKDVNFRTLFTEFKTGVGPEYSLFKDGHPMVNDLKKSWVVTVATMTYLLRGNRTLLDYDVPFGLLGLGMSYSLTEQFIGGARVSIIPTFKGILFIVTNSTGIYSGTYHLSKDKKRSLNKITPYGTTHQMFIWTEPYKK